MSKDKNTHTPGPWHESKTGDHQGLIISEATGDNIAVSYDKRDTNPIAAAPDLLEACQEYQVLSERIKDNLSGDVCAEIGLYRFDNQVQEAINRCG